MNTERGLKRLLWVLSGICLPGSVIWAIYNNARPSYNRPNGGIWLPLFELVIEGVIIGTALLILLWATFYVGRWVLAGFRRPLGGSET